MNSCFPPVEFPAPAGVDYCEGTESTTKLKGSGQFGTVRPKTAVNFRVNGRIREMVLGPSSSLKCLHTSFMLGPCALLDRKDSSGYVTRRPRLSSTRIDYLFRASSPDYKLKSWLAFNTEDRREYLQSEAFLISVPRRYVFELLKRLNREYTLLYAIVIRRHYMLYIFTIVFYLLVRFYSMCSIEKENVEGERIYAFKKIDANR